MTRILVYEFVSGGGFAGKAVPPSLGRQGMAMRNALVMDLCAIGVYEIIVTVDPRFPLNPLPGVRAVTVSSAKKPALNDLIALADAVWLVAPETDRCLERLAVRVERLGKPLLGPNAIAIRFAADKSNLAAHLARLGVPHPATRTLTSRSDYVRIARDLGYPVVVKPAHGAGCEGVCVARHANELRHAVRISLGASDRGRMLMQSYISGVAASVSLVADGQRALPLALNAQNVRAGQPFTYEGGKTPLEHPLATRATGLAQRACEALPGLRGFVGVDMVLTDSEAFLVEVNPRLTMAYLGLRAAVEDNVAALALAASQGTLPAYRSVKPRSVRFTATGQIAR
jgi:predicted ATP-grasp superfamily ATP-dependent carboligase